MRTFLNKQLESNKTQDVKPTASKTVAGVLV